MIWYPYQQMKTMKAPYEIVKAEGPYLYTKDAKLLDCQTVPDLSIRHAALHTQ